ncbi:MAG: hypothetical protein E6Q27_01255 [Aeromicrobium sp.]|nr:MAG: hypothetical protein E6Q27_01255 [Aeromicrobium sp.]
MSQKDSVVVDCGDCLVRSEASCRDCVVTVLLGMPSTAPSFDQEELSALAALADADLIPPLRLVVATETSHEGMRHRSQNDHFPNVV